MKTALKKLKRQVPYGWDLNIYRGCQHNCIYCYALYSHQYLGARDFAQEIFVKVNIVEALERQLADPAWKREIINIGGVTDSYQPAEEQCRLMPEILNLLIKHRNPAIISTKSALILRDYDLLDSLSRLTYLNVAATIITTDEELRTKLEGTTASSAERFAFLREFRNTNASVGLHVMPIIPYLTDHENNFKLLFAQAHKAKVHYVLPGVLYLLGPTRERFFSLIHQEFPDKLEQLKALYKTGSAGKEYKNTLYPMVNKLRNQHGLSSSYMRILREKLK